MLFHSSLRKELSRSFGATLVVLVTVVTTMTLIRTLGQASRGNFNPSDVTLVMGYTVLAYMPTLLTMSLFIAIIATLSRMYRESEMVIWFCSGKGLSTLLSPLMRFSWPVFALVAALALLVLPWSNQRIENLRDQYEQRGDLDRVEPGQFQESGNGNRVFFVEKTTEGQVTGSNVFIASTERGKETVTSARSGRIELLPQGPFLMLSNGQRLESTVGAQNLKVSDFELYGAKISSNVTGYDAITAVDTLTTLELLEKLTPLHLGELSWRLGLMLAAINLVIIGVAISSVNPRANKSANVVLALFTFVVYFNLLKLGQSWIAAGLLSFTSYLLLLHGGVFVMATLWLAKGHNNWHWKNLLPRRPTSTEVAR
ncbi:LPS export ABC transporter permease LptF [Rhodoferax fermentans]|uniref:Lipopolysaccharide export system permease protein LptF n=1 Tax=Rhodoferax fermentans TaxID=28066 RepID=A0A1T1AUV7_RHOFE|nr:LPS export ABC transporter permease LptF [Rhodoferax fermentans]MBK1682873.1 LPS export ABC transporter permease LptF [Rhodoferax fermentans]OOV07728.1 LPS export ABC transporter permease LptF [Rhodoferax fermentans]